MWPTTLEVTLGLARERHKELLEAAEAYRALRARSAQRIWWKQVVGRQLVRLGDWMIVRGAALRRGPADQDEPAPLVAAGQVR